MKQIMNKNRILLTNADCMDFMYYLWQNNKKVNIILTSPPYNTSRTHGTMENHEVRYDVYTEERDNEEYIDWTIELFNYYNKILEKDGVILYNVSYGNENPSLMWLTISAIIERTDFMVADNIIWKKKTALPNNVSSNKLTRLTEYVLVICRKTEYKTFQMNKKVKSISKTGQKYYENVYNIIDAKNNDGSCSLNKATFSSDLCEQLLKLYAFENDIIYDSFCGTGTTLVACKKLNLRGIGTELSPAQCEYAKERLEKMDIEYEKNS